MDGFSRFHGKYGKNDKTTWMITRGSPILGHLHITMYNWDVPSGICSEFSESRQSEEVKSRGYRKAHQLCFLVYNSIHYASPIQCWFTFHIDKPGIIRAFSWKAWDLLALLELKVWHMRYISRGFLWCEGRIPWRSCENHPHSIGLKLFGGSKPC
jgi:hypothetical protein